MNKTFSNLNNENTRCDIILELLLDKDIQKERYSQT